MTTREYLQRLAKFDPSSIVPTLDDAKIEYGFYGVAGSWQNSEFALVKQVHGSRIVSADHDAPLSLAKTEADGVATAKIKTAVGVVTADCLPLLVADLDKSLVMAVHAGWKGLAKGIVFSAIDFATERSVRIERLHFVLGPCIDGNDYEVGPEVIEAFTNGNMMIPDDDLNLCIGKRSGDRWQLDIALIATMQLRNIGVKAEQISVVRSSTLPSASGWYSYRREGKGVGRNLSWISL